MAESVKDQHLEIYKLHAELADRVSQRREGANRLYVSLQLGLVVFLAALFRFGTGDLPAQLVHCTIGTLGALLSVSWYIILRSYRQLNSNKFRVLHELEKKLDYQFFIMEWDPKSEGKKSNRYLRLTVVEVTLPTIFFLLFVGVAIFSILR